MCRVLPRQSGFDTGVLETMSRIITLRRSAHALRAHGYHTLAGELEALAMAFALLPQVFGPDQGGHIPPTRRPAPPPSADRQTPWRGDGAEVIPLKEEAR